MTMTAVLESLSLQIMLALLTVRLISSFLFECLLSLGVLCHGIEIYLSFAHKKREQMIISYTSHVRNILSVQLFSFTGST